MRYSSIHDSYQFYFYDMNSYTYALRYAADEIARFGRPHMYHTKLIKEIPSHIWVEGTAIVGSRVFELGCGLGILGRILGRLAKCYVGVDVSPFALSLAQFTSPRACQYYRLSDTGSLKALAKTVDTCVSRHFFIHHNYEDAVWILRFLRDLTKRGCIITADFFSHPESIDGVRRFHAADRMSELYASALYDFSHTDFVGIPEDIDLKLIHVDYQPELESQFATFQVLE